MIFSLVPSLGYLGKCCSEIHVHDFVKMCVIFSLGYIYLGMKLLSHMKLFNFLKNANLLSKDAVPFYNPPAIFESSNFSTPSPVLDLFD